MVNYDQMLSDRVKVVKPSGIRRFFEMAAKMPHAISLGVGEPDFETPWQIRRAGIQSLEKGQTFYTSNWGLAELRSQIAALARRKYQLCYDADKEILVTVGGSEAIDNTIRALVNPGEEVLIPEPSFVCYTPLTQMAGGVPVPLPTRVEDKFKLTPEALRAAITPRTKLLILPYPNNPTGAIMDRDERQQRTLPSPSPPPEGGGTVPGRLPQAFRQSASSSADASVRYFLPIALSPCIRRHDRQTAAWRPPFSHHL